jgi:hypothetical protein
MITIQLDQGQQQQVNYFDKFSAAVTSLRHRRHFFEKEYPMKTHQFICLIMLLIVLFNAGATSNVMKNRSNTSQGGQSSEQQAQSTQSCESQQQSCLLLHLQEHTTSLFCEVQLNDCLEQLPEDADD